MSWHKSLDRRSFLLGTGAAVALPFLDAMFPSFARAAASQSPLRMAFVYVPNGIIMEQWAPETQGAIASCSGAAAYYGCARALP